VRQRISAANKDSAHLRQMQILFRMEDEQRILFNLQTQAAEGSRNVTSGVNDLIAASICFVMIGLWLAPRGRH
jgi:hypothetical protein